MTDPQPHVRIQQNVLARGERRLLDWLCPRLPAFLTSDALTALGVLGALLVAAGYGASGLDRDWLFLAVFGYVLNWFGDSLDGSVARFRKAERPRYGYFLDHSVDGVAVMAMLVGLGLSPYVRLETALLALSGYLLLAIHAFLSAKVVGELQLSQAGAGPTELRLVLIALTLCMHATGPRPTAILGLSIYDALIAGAGIVMTLIYIGQTARIARRLGIEEPPRR